MNLGIPDKKYVLCRNCREIWVEVSVYAEIGYCEKCANAEGENQGNNH